MKNQCDGCNAGIPVINGSHRMGREGGYPDLIGCTAKLYAPDPLRAEFEASPRFKGMDFTRAVTHPEYYESPYANGTWDGWKASVEIRYTAVDMTTAAADGFRDGVAKLNAAYLAGWNASGEGWNGEYPSDAHTKPDWEAERDKAIEAVISADVSKEG